eukprot:gb/GECH01013241.1/.p1 GENE.gb/GECH01013241.1/~~gb/GECH01013241.1/.p1  ORF type:complete len:727 (+),score=193.33 gb/GECH01013241.1/:1-2181(+)
MKILFNNNSCPYSAFIVNRILGEHEINFVYDEKTEITQAELHLNNGRIIRGNNTIASFLCKSAKDKKGLFTSEDEDTIKIEQFLEFSSGELLSTEDKTLAIALQRLNHHLTFRTFLIGYHLTLADLAVYEALKNNKMWNAFKANHGRKPQLIHLTRYFKYLESLPEINENTKLIFTTMKKKSNSDDQIRKHDARKAAEDARNKNSSVVAEGSFIELEGAEMGKVMTRFPPEPSGYLHIGHAKAALLNNYFARLYDGKLLIRFDDTNPDKEKTEYEEAILEDLKSLKIKHDIFGYTSDHFELILQYAEQMLKDGKAYIDMTPIDEMRQQRMEGIESQYRHQSVGENMKLWNEMKQGTETGLKCCMRAKLDMTNNNKALRDPTLYRCNLKSHARSGDKYKVYPTYDFACPIVDSVDGVTHTLRTSEYHDRDPQYYWVCDALGIRKPKIWDYGRLNMRNTLMSKRKLQWFVDNDIVEGWFDPRFPTVQGLLRCGMTVEALTEFVLSQGASKNINYMTWDKLWTINKKIIDPLVPRYTAIHKNSIVKLTLTDGPKQVEVQEKPKYKKNLELGNKKCFYYREVYLEQDDAQLLKDQEEVTLIDWGNAIIDHVEKDGDQVTQVTGHLHLSGDVKKTQKKLTWLAIRDELIPVKTVHYGHLITKEILDDNDEFRDYINPHSKVDSYSIGDEQLKDLKKGDKLQLERRGYFICDQAFDGEHVILIEIPDGRQKN